MGSVRAEPVTADRALARRITAGGVLVGVIAAGLAVHSLLPDTAATDIAGDGLYAAAVYVAVVLVAPRLPVRVVGALAAGWCVVIELFQLTGVPLALGAQFPPAMLVLGTVFDPRDLVVYVVTVAIVAAVDAAARAVSRVEPVRRRRAIGGILIAAITMLVTGVVVAVMLQFASPETAAPTSKVSAKPAPAPTRTPTPTPTPVGYPANTGEYDVTALPQVSVFAVIPDLPVDDQPFAPSTPERAVPLGIGAPVWADPTGEPVAYLPRELPFDGTTVPVVEKQQNWVKVLLVGRQSVPSAGDPSQVAGWLRTADVEFAPSADSVLVSISARTVDIVRDGVAERVATDFGWGADLTPTPLGRAYIMTTRVVPEYGYTRGHPIVYLSVQSPTLDGFGGADAAVTAFHYHDDRSGPISNGCIRVDPAAITALAALPLGTPVTISP